MHSPFGRLNRHTARAIVVGALVVAATLAAPSTAAAGPLMLERAAPSTGARLDAAYIPADSFDAVDLLIGGSYAFSSLAGVELAVPLGFYIPESADSETVLGNIDLAGRFGFDLDLGVAALAIGGALHMYLPTASDDTAGLLSSAHLRLATLGRPGLRTFQTFTIQPSAAASVRIAIVEVYGSIGPSIGISTNGDGTSTTLQGGAGVQVNALGPLGIFAEFVSSEPLEDTGDEGAYQVATGLRASLPIITAGLNVRIPVDSASSDLVPVIVGAEVALSF